MLGLDLVSGRGFTPAERTAEAGVAVVSESLARQLWPNGSGVGQVVRLEAPPSESPDGLARRGAQRGVEPSRTLTVVGIVRDPGPLPGRLLDSPGVTFRPDPRVPGRS